MTQRPETPWESTDPNLLPTQPWTAEGLTAEAEEAGFSSGPPELSTATEEPAVEEAEEADEEARPQEVEAQPAEPAPAIDLLGPDAAAWDAWFDSSVDAANAAAAAAPPPPSAGIEEEVEELGSGQEDRWWLEPEEITPTIEEAATEDAMAEEASTEEVTPEEVVAEQPRATPGQPATPSQPEAPGQPDETPQRPRAAGKTTDRVFGSPVMERYTTPTFGVREPTAGTSRAEGSRAASAMGGSEAAVDGERVFSPPDAQVDTMVGRSRPATPEDALRAEYRQQTATMSSARASKEPWRQARPTGRGGVPAGEPDRLVSVVMTGASLLVVLFLVVGFVVIFTDLL